MRDSAGGSAGDAAVAGPGSVPGSGPGSGPVPGAAIWPYAAAVCWLGSLIWVGTQIGVGGVFAGLGAAVLVMLPVMSALWWLGRRVVEPRTLLNAFVWGACVAAAAAIVLQTAGTALTDNLFGESFTRTFGPLVWTPLTEEVGKGLFVIGMLIYRRRQINGLLDGIVYAGTVGAGFAFTENSLYLGRAVMGLLAPDASSGFGIGMIGMTFVMRVLAIPFMHSMFTAMVGIGVVLAVRSTRSAARVAWVGAGLLVAIALHGLWDWAGLTTGRGFLLFQLYFFVMVPLFVALVVTVLVARRRQRRLVTASGSA